MEKSTITVENSNFADADIQPIQLSDSDGSDPTTGQIAKAIGWGKDADDADWISTVLREVDIPIMDHLDCNAAYGAVPDNTICTDGSGGKGVCGVSQERKNEVEEL